MGVNPLNRSWLTGLGDNPIVGPTHRYGWSTYQGLIPPGVQSEGPIHNPPDTWFPDHAPNLEDTPTMYNDCDVRYCIPLNEGVITSQAMTAMTLGLLLPDRDDAGDFDIAGSRPRDIGIVQRKSESIAILFASQ